MSEFCLQPDVYRTGSCRNLLGLLEDIWINRAPLGEGTFYIVSGFGNYNGGVRFFSTLKRHVDSGGKVECFFGAGTSQRLTSYQLVEKLLSCGCDVHLINRKQIFHTKCYGTGNSGDRLIVTSGNFTANGMAHNVESALFLDYDLTRQIQFRWSEFADSILRQKWEIYTPSLSDLESPAWKVVYDEREERIKIDDSQAVSMVVTLSHADTARINAPLGSKAGLGTQYFWLSKDAYDFFPPLTIPNKRGIKDTYSCHINLHYKDLGFVDQSTVTFEAGNNVDFRLRTSKYRYTHVADRGDLAVISRISEYDYEIRIIRQGSNQFNALSPFATTFIGNRDKRLGFIPNDKLESILGIQLPTRKQFAQLPRT